MEQLQMLDESYEDLAWFQQNFEKLKTLHVNEFVAFSKKTVLGSSSSLSELLSSLEKEEVDMSRVMVEFIRKDGIVL